MDLLDGYRQHAPYHVEIEPTEGCNLGCSFCGLRGIRERGTTPWKFMSVDDAERISSAIREAHWDKTEITFCGHGEPTLNPDLLRIIEVFRRNLPKNTFTLWTNGAGFRNGLFEINDFIIRLRELRVTDIRLDVYSDKGDWTAIEQLRPEVYDTSKIAIIGQDGADLNYRGRELRIVLYPMDVGDMNAWLRNLANHCGAAAPLNFERKDKRCHKPFRYMFVRWNGLVCLCCDDFRGQYIIGNITEYDNADDLWNHERYQAARIMLYHKQRTFRPCLGCSRVAIRAGLLPDPCARDGEQIPQPQDVSVLKEVLDEAFQPEGSTTIVKRKWEK